MLSDSLNTQQKLSLECYLQLKQSQKLISERLFECKSKFFEILPEIAYHLKSINILIPLGDEDIEELGESELGQILTMIDQDPHRSWISFVWIVPEGYQEDFETYLNFIHDELEIKSLKDDELLVLDLPTLKENWSSISYRFDGYWDLSSLIDNELIKQNCQEQYSEIFSDLPKISWQSDRLLTTCLYEALLQQVETVDRDAAQAFSRSDWTKAIELYQATVRLNPINPNNWANLGSSYFKQGNYIEAKECLEQAIVLNSNNQQYFNTLGSIYEYLQQHKNAIIAYKNAIQIAPKEGITYCNLGDLLVKLLQYEDAEKIYQEGLASDPWYYGLYLNLANLWVLQGKNMEALRVFQKAEYLNPNDPDLDFNRSIAHKSTPTLAQYYYARSLKKQGKYQEALPIFEHIIQTHPLCPRNYEPEVHIDYLDCLKVLHYEEKILEAIKTALHILINQKDLSQINLLFIRRLFNYLNRKGEHQQSQVLVRELNFFSVPAFNDLFAQLNLPILYHTESEILIYRDNFIAALERMSQINITKPRILDEAYILVKALLNFYTTYQNFNDLDIQNRLSGFIHKILIQKKSKLSKIVNNQSKVKTKKIKVGYLSNHLQSHSGTIGILGWIGNHNPAKFEYVTYHLGLLIDYNTQKFAIASEHFRHICLQDFRDLDQWLDVITETIHDDDLDILVFTDVGMDIKSTLLSRLRLAPIQCVLWGHPITTGSKTIDYFLTASLMEPDDADHHYSERLVHLPNISWSYPNVPLPEEKKTRPHFQLPDDRILYFSCQSLFKYLPQHDYIYPAIAQRVPNAYFIFLDIFDIKPIFWQRLKNCFDAVNLEIENYCKILPRQSHSNFLALQGLSDIYLDTLTWSGGNTTLQALAWPIPVVTCPNKFMRGRHSYGILQSLGVTETIAHSEQEYIEIASELGLNPQWRSFVIEKIKSRNHRLYNDLQCVQAVETFFEYAYEKYQDDMIQQS